jgi:hypothetical protein
MEYINTYIAILGVIILLICCILFLFGKKIRELDNEEKPFKRSFIGHGEKEDAR